MSAQPIGVNQDITEAAAEHTLAALRRHGLIRSWQTTDRSYTVVVGRGTVRIPAMDAAGVLRLAQKLRRDKVTVSSGGHPVGHRIVRYHLSDGRYADRHDSRVGRFLDDYPYTVYLPGGAPSGCAAVSFAARTQKEALALAGLARVRGCCARCHTLRPLHVCGWKPDPGIPCPGCRADAATPVTLLCRTCQQPIVPTTSPDPWPLRAAWQHAATGTPFCQTGHRPHGFRRPPPSVSPLAADDIDSIHATRQRRSSHRRRCCRTPRRSSRPRRRSPATVRTAAPARRPAPDRDRGVRPTPLTPGVSDREEPTCHGPSPRP